MTRKQVWQYRCGYCGKRGLSSGAMGRHEKRCTLNPDRICGVCAYCKKEQPKLYDLLAMLPKADPSRIAWPKVDWVAETLSPESKAAEDAVKAYREGLREQVKKVWDDLYQASDECPACTLAALRQSGCAPVVDWWKFKDDLKETMCCENDRQAHNGYY